MRRELLTLGLLIPLVSGSNPLVALRSSHPTESVRLLKANETVHPSGSDLVFSWAKCVICDGYDARLYLEDMSGVQSIPHRLKAAVTSLKIKNISPRTVYRFVVKRLPSDKYNSEVSGRTFSRAAPLPVENLKVRPLANSSIQIEWTSESADGFIARILRNNTVIQEKVVPDFRNHSVENIRNLEPGTEYQVQVTAFYFPPGGNSISPVSSARVTTLPEKLPEVHPRWEFDESEFKIFWENPKSPCPVRHRLNCTGNSRPLMDARLGAANDFVAITNLTDITDIGCLLETWFAIDDRAKITTRFSATKAKPTAPSSTEYFWCENHGTMSARISMTLKLEEINNQESVLLALTKPEQWGYSRNFEVEYQLCERYGSCPDRWTTLRGDDPTLRLDFRNLKAWLPYTLRYRLGMRCHYNNGARKHTHSLEIPGLRGPVDPVSEIAATATAVSWNYNTPALSPDYFLVTYCTEAECASQSVPGKERSLSFGQLEENSIHYVTIQAVRVRGDSADISPSEMVSIIKPKLESSDNVTLSYKEATNSSTVQLIISRQGTASVRPIAAYHIAVCSKPLALLNESTSFSTTCDTVVSSNSSIDLVREPWTLYEVFVLPCYGDFDADQPANLTLPIYKHNPSALGRLSWTQENALLRWNYGPSIASGFWISICPIQKGISGTCIDARAGPRVRLHKVDGRTLPDGGFIARVKPFVTYEGITYNGTGSELAVEEFYQESSTADPWLDEDDE